MPSPQSPPVMINVKRCMKYFLYLNGRAAVTNSSAAVCTWYSFPVMLDFFVRRAEHKGEFGRLALNSAEAERNWSGCPVTRNGLPGALSRAAICLPAVTTELRSIFMFISRWSKRVVMCSLWTYDVTSLEWNQRGTQSLSNCMGEGGVQNNCVVKRRTLQWRFISIEGVLLMGWFSVTSRLTAVSPLRHNHDVSVESVPVKYVFAGTNTFPSLSQHIVLFPLFLRRLRLTFLFLGLPVYVYQRSLSHFDCFAIIRIYLLI
jgi:hypothetical protein